MSEDPVREELRNNRKILVIDFLYRDANGGQRRYRRDVSAHTRRAARAEARRLMALAARTGSPTPGTPAGVATFRAFYEELYRKLVLPRLRPATRQRYQALTRQGIFDFFGRVPLDEIDALVVRRYEALLHARGVGVRGHVNFIRSVMRAAVELGVLVEMPALPRAPGPGKKLPRAPSLEDVEAALRASRGWVRAAIVLGFLAGLRCGELRALQVRDVLFDENVLVVRRAFSENALADSPKDKEERVIPLAPRVREVLAEVTAGKGARDFVVVNGHGKVPSRQAVWLAVRAAQERAGVERPFGVHALRHRFCSELARQGVSVEVVRALAGHGDLRTTQRYLHAARPELHAAISRLV